VRVPHLFLHNREIKHGEWYQIETEEQFNSLFESADNKIGVYEGPGKYFLLSYADRKPCGCCVDMVYETLPQDAAELEIDYQIKQEQRLCDERIDKLKSLLTSEPC